VTHAAVAAQVHQTLDVHGQFATQIAFNNEGAYSVTQLFELAVVQILDLFIGRYARRVTDFLCAWAAYTVDGRETNNRVLMIWDVNPCNTCHSLSSINNVKLTLTLLVTRFHADYADDTFALDDLAVAADPLD
jgi:hypothetical protein